MTKFLSETKVHCAVRKDNRNGKHRESDFKELVIKIIIPLVFSN